ncbi:hypothetical protein PJI17_18165 [Mycobacterium kansasii]|uniref:Uncharacterized protein n=3 Tax=Mycobacterium kansasii TaxID=1768 RepID=A0A1V3WHQ5_MYCKA|nr:hypothetical protein I547_5242 [Mycobacterium kansasii 824]OOK65966.1 hypothetical protein BZL29_7634 [Mycobacterium kansasii]
MAASRNGELFACRMSRRSESLADGSKVVILRAEVPPVQET